MSARAWWVAVLTAVCLAGCGGAGGGGQDGGGSGVVRGNLGAQRSGAVVRIEGTDRSTVVAADGSFEVAGVPEGEYTLSATVGGQVATAVVRVGPGRPTEVPPLDWTLGGLIAGIITSRDGEGRLTPLAGARVTARLVPQVWYTEGQAGDTFVGEVVAAGGKPNGRAEEPTSAPPRIATTNASGEYVFSAVAPGPYSIEVSAENHESGEVGTWVEPGSAATGNLALLRIDPHNATLSGSVLGSQSGGLVPLAHVLVALRRTDGPIPLAGAEGGGGGVAPPAVDSVIEPGTDPWAYPFFWYYREGLSDESGRYVIRNVPPGEYEVSFLRYGYRAVTRTVTLAQAQQATADATLDYTLTKVSGTVYGRTAGGTAPLAGVWVSAYPARVLPMLAELDTPTSGGGSSGSGSTGGGTTTIWPYLPPPDGAVSDANGRYQLEVEAGELVVSAWKEGYEWGSVELTVGLGGRTGVDLTLAVASDQITPMPPETTPSGG